MKSFVIIVAGGVGTRMGSSTPKQFLNLGNKPILAHTITRVNKISPKSELIVVLPKNQIDYWKSICNKYNINIEHKIVEGGNTRFESVKNGFVFSKGLFRCAFCYFCLTLMAAELSVHL